MSDKTPKTIEFFLPQGEPRGVRIAKFTTGSVKAVCFPRNKLPEAMKRPELKSVGVYFLFGESEESPKPMVYIGEAEECGKRFIQHNADENDFWHMAVAVVSKESFTKVHAKYLEWYCIKKAKEVGRYALANGNEGGEPFVPEPMLADLMVAFDTLNILVSVLGFPLFEPQSKATAPDVFVLSGEQCEARGKMLEDGIKVTVFAGSKGRKEIQPSAGKWIHDLRQELLNRDVITQHDDQIFFKEDHTFTAPSSAAMVLLGRTANGWIEWKNAAGITLDKAKRQSA